MFGFLLEIVLSVCICWFHNMVTLPPWLVSTDFGTCQYQCFLSNCTLVSLHMLKCSCLCTHTIMSFYVLFFCQYLAGWYCVVYCLVKSLAKSALVICFCVQYYYYYYWMQLHFGRCVIRMQHSTTTPTDEGRSPYFQYSGLVLKRQICATLGEESGSRTRSPGTWSGSVPPSLVYVMMNNVGTVRD